MIRRNSDNIIGAAFFLPTSDDDDDDDARLVDVEDGGGTTRDDDDDDDDPPPPAPASPAESRAARRIGTILFHWLPSGPFVPRPDDGKGGSSNDVIMFDNVRCDVAKKSNKS